MLIRTIFIIALLCALGGAIVHGAAALADARVRRAAAVAADRAFSSAIAAVQREIAVEIAAGADPRSLALVPPAVAPECTPLGTAHPCALSAQAIVSGTLTAATGSATAGSCAPLCAPDLQENDAIAEGRAAVRVRVTVTGETGVAFARRERYAIFRTLRVAPYAALAGTRDGGTDALASGAAEGDDAGAPATTTANVRYVNAQTGEQIDANAWASRGWSNADAGGASWDP